MHLTKYLAFIPLLSSSWVNASQCKCSPSEPCWPSPFEWTSFNTTLSGRLIKTTPPASVCYPSSPNHNQLACTAVLANWTDSSFHSADPASVDDPSAANSSCNPIYPNGSSITGDVNAGARGCGIGYYPPYVVNASEGRDVQAALRFAGERGLRLVVKNTGHNGVISTGYGSLSIWTHNLKGFEFHQSFQPQSCNASAHMAATIGAGMQDGELFAAMAKHNAIAVGGTNQDVGVIGWATGGGHGLATGVYSMGADNILQAEIVTPTGSLLTANPCQNADIFWAIRGGGGGTFGVILSLTVKAYPMPSVSLMGFDVKARNHTSIKDWYRLVAKMHVEFDRLQESGVGGYYTMSGPPLAISGALLQYGVGNRTAGETLSGLRGLLHGENGTATSSLTQQWVEEWYDLVANLPVFETVGTQKGASASRFIPRRALQDLDLLADTLEKVGPGLTAPSNGISNPSISGTMTGSRKPVNNALNPAWRDSIVHIITSQSWNDSLPQSLVDATTHDMTWKRGYALRQLAPDTGAYFNEASKYEPNWQWSFWGENYPRLRVIKEKYDPEGILWCHHCVGSERWVQQENGSLCAA